MDLFGVPRSLVIPILATVFFYIVMRHLASRKIDGREPPVVGLALPYLGALIGMVVQGGKWLRDLAIQTKEPIFTIAMPGSRMYIVSDPALTAAVQRNKNLSFSPLIPEATQRILGLDAETVKIVRKNLIRENNNERGFIPDIHDMVYAYMAPGESLDELSASASVELAKLVRHYQSTLQALKGQGKVEDLLLWCQHFVTVATARFLYGPKNPIDVDSENEDAFWDFDHGLGFLLVNVMPSITAKKAYKGRERLVSALQTYLKEGHHKTASQIVQNRVEISLRHGWKIDMIARGELSFLFAGIVNTAITSFWLILHIFARPDLLAEVRGELASALGDLKSAHAANATTIRNQCPIFMSIFRETLRVGSENSSTRIVLADTVLADQYFLKKDSVLQVVGGAMHVDQRIWGPDANNFDPYRFHEDRLKKQDKIHPAAYRAFGGGATLCPGRHFATNEITSFVALVVILFDVEPVGGGSFVIPRKRDNVLPIHILEPVRHVDCTIKLRA